MPKRTATPASGWATSTSAPARSPSGKDKHGKPRQRTMRQVAADFLEEHVKDKLPAASIFARTGGTAWNKDTWKCPIKDAVKAAGLAGATSAYTLRHSAITGLIRARLPILTVEQLSGTSVSMIEKHQGHLVRDVSEEALASIAIWHQPMMP